MQVRAGASVRGCQGMRACGYCAIHQCVAETPCARRLLQRRASAALGASGMAFGCQVRALAAFLIERPCTLHTGQQTRDMLL